MIMRSKLAGLTAILLGLAALLALAAPAQAACALGKAGATVSVETKAPGRPVLVHLPAGFNPAKPAPLVLLMHGSGGTAAGMLASSKLEATADKHGFIVVSLQGVIPARAGFVWNIPGVPSITGEMPAAAAQDDVAWIMGVVDQLAGAGCVDKTRVYATGLSGGGRMSSLLGCTQADRIAAIAPVVGLRAGNPLASDKQKADPATCKPSRAVPVITFAGDKDTVNPIQGGGTAYWQYPMSEAEKRWAELNGCKSPRPIRQVTATVHEEGYRDCKAGADVIAHVTRGGEHVWLADNDVMWAFLSAHRR